MDNQSESFRDHIATVNDDGGRIWIYPKKPSGKFYNLRTYVSYFLLIVLFGIPFLKINGQPLFLLNVLERNFILFGINFTPQDLHLFALAMITLMLFVVLFTVIFGRLFCGWVCPQTIFLEMVFRKIEYWIEGDSNRQRKLNKAPWTSEKIFKKGFKHLIFFIIAILIANTFLSYIIGVDKVKEIIFEPLRLHISGFIAMILFSAVFYAVFAFMREQVCIAICPYGRLQGVLLVKNSIVVIYDWIRGEPRGKMRKQKEGSPEPPPLGDCIDCTLCVQVCPTGIDIRNGTQLECVNCTACIDACDEVMEKIDRPKGLIRYDSHSNIEEKKSKIFTPRVIAYIAVLSGLVLFQSFLFASRSEVEANILRTPGMLFQKIEGGYISNLYNYTIINKTNKPIANIRFELVDADGRIRLVGKLLDIAGMESSKGSLFVEMEEASLDNRKTKLKINVYSNDLLIDKLKTNFLGPIR